jgi:serine/threonine protein kinase
MSARDVGVADPPQRLLLAMEQLLSSERTVAEFRDELLNMLYAEPSTAQPTRALIEEYARRGLIPQPIERLLMSDIDKVVDEEIPTTPTELTLTADMPASLDDEFEETQGQGNNKFSNADAAPPAQPEKPAREGGRLEIGDMLRGRFEICGRAPGGSMGVVYKAIDRRLAEVGDAQAYVAIKVLAPQLAGNAAAIRALQQEAARGRYLHHPNIVQFLDLDRDGELVFLVMEWLEGRTLSSILNDRPGQPLDPELAGDIVRSVGAALEYAHGLGVTHADVKPGNVMVQPSGAIKLLDFGIARVRGRLAMAMDQSLTTMLQAATPAYASPQVLSGRAARPRDDVYSLGCLTYRLYAGRRPFGNKTAKSAAEAGERIERIASLSRRQWQALQRALAFSQEDRMASAREFLDAFADQSPAERAGGFWRRHAALVAVIVSITALFALTMWLSAPPPPDRPATSVQPLIRPSAAATEAGAAGVMPATDGSTDAVGADSVQEALPVSGDAETDPEQSAPDRPPALGGALDETVIEFVLPAAGGDVVERELVLPEGGQPGTIRLMTSDPAAEARSFRLVPGPVSEALTPVLASQFKLDGDTLITFDSTRSSHELTVENLADDLIEPDHTLVYALTDASSGAVVARLTLRLEDDDRRRFAAAIPPNTVCFAVPEIRIRESDATVRVPIWRLNATGDTSYARLLVTAGSAAPNEDFFVEDGTIVTFEPGASGALLFVPLVQDEVFEPDETFTIELADTVVMQGLFHRLRITVLDDEF